MPRYIWFKAAWSPNTLADTWTAIAAQRLDAKWRDDVLIPDLVPKDARITPMPEQVSKPKESRVNSRNVDTNGRSDESEKKVTPKTKDAARKGPCSFGCQVTTAKQQRTGKQQWNSVPSPSPWPGKQPGETLCKKCYDKALAINRRSAMAQAAVDIHRNAEKRRCTREEAGNAQACREPPNPPGDVTRSAEHADLEAKRSTLADCGNSRDALFKVV